MSIQKRLSTLVTVGVVSLIALSFTFFGVEHLLLYSSKNDTIVKIGSRAITNDDIQKKIQSIRQGVVAQYGVNYVEKPEIQQMLRRQALQAVVRQNVMSRYLFAHGYKISPVLVQDALQSNVAFMEDKVFALKKFDNYVAFMKSTPEQYIQDLSLMLSLEQIEQALHDSDFVLDAERQKYRDLLYQKRKFSKSYLYFSDIKRQVTVTPQELHAYYRQHQSEFMHPAKVKVKYIQLTVSDLKATLQPTEQNLREYYQDNIGLYQKNDKHQHMHTQGFNVVRKAVIEGWKSQQANKLYADRVEELSDLVYTNPETLNTAARALDLPIYESTYFEEKNSKDDLGRHDNIVQAAFSDDVLKNKNNSNVLKLGSDKVLVLRIADYQKAHYLPFDTVKTVIYSAVLDEKTQHKAQEMAQLSLNQLARIGKLPSGVHYWSRDYTIDRWASPQEVTDVVFAMPHPQRGEPSYQSLTMQDKGILLIRLDDIIYPNQDKQFSDSMNNKLIYSDLMQASYLQSLFARAKVKFVSSD